MYTPIETIVNGAKLLSKHWTVEFDEFDDREYLVYTNNGKEWVFFVDEVPDAVTAAILISAQLVHEVDQLPEYELITYGDWETVIIKDEGETLVHSVSGYGARSINDLVCIVESRVLEDE